MNAPTRCLVLSAAVMLGLAACESNRRHAAETDAGQAGITIEYVAREIAVGDTITFAARTHDTYGRDAKIEWSSTVGKVTTENDGRNARVEFSESGTYSVKAMLRVNGAVVDTDMVEVRVRPLS